MKINILFTSLKHLFKICNKQTYSFSTSPKKLQYISDIHLEYRTKIPHIPKCGDYLALLGDIGNPFKENYSELIKQKSNEYEKVFVLAGNHEYWQKKYMVSDVNNRINTIVNQFKNVYFMNQTKINIGCNTILGTTLWSHIKTIPLIKRGDDVHIKTANNNIIDELNKLHTSDVEWLKTNVMNTSNKNIIVLTHHLPSYQLIIDKYRKVPYLNHMDRFASPLDYLLTPFVDAWLTGHSHCTYETKINGVFCGINAYGYPVQSLRQTNQNISRWIMLK